MSKVLQKPPILAYRHNKHLKEILVHKKHNAMCFKHQNKCEPCKKNCAICPNVRNTETFSNFDGSNTMLKIMSTVQHVQLQMYYMHYFANIAISLFM